MGFNIDRTINDYISQADWRVKENSQTNYSFSGLQGHISNSVLVEYALENMYTGEIARAHEDALFHIHDISHPLVGYCFTGDTLINLWGDHGSYIPVTIKELAENETYYTKGFLVASINFEGKVCPGYARFPRITRRQAELVEISLTNGKKIRCTPDHQFMLSDMSYKEAQDLTIDDKLMTGSEDIILVNGRSVLPYTEDVYDFTVEGYHNFMLSSGVFVHNCAGWSMEDLLRKGFSCGPNYIYSNPAKHLDALYGQVNNFIFTLTGEWAGAQALNSFDTYSAGFIKNDHMTELQVYRVLRRLIFDLNVKTRIAMQSPFSNISVDLTVPEDLKYKPVIIGGKDQDFTYGECQAEMDLFNHVLAKVMMEGDGMHKIFTFPIITYGITPDFPWDSKLAEDIFTFADEANSPYFSNFINSDQSPSDIRSMCPMTPDTKIRVKINNEIVDTELSNLADKHFMTFFNGEWRNSKLRKVTPQLEVIITDDFGNKVHLGEHHQHTILRNRKVVTVNASDITTEDYMIYDENGVFNFSKVTEVEHTNVTRSDLLCVEVSE